MVDIDYLTNSIDFFEPIKNGAVLINNALLSCIQIVCGGGVHIVFTYCAFCH